MCVQLKADVYVFGAQGRDYADVESFRAARVVPYSSKNIAIRNIASCTASFKPYHVGH